MVEKPGGHDLESARALATELHRFIDESQLYRIDAPGVSRCPMACLDTSDTALGSPARTGSASGRGGRSHARPGRRPGRGTLAAATAAGIDLAAVTAELEREGVRSFCDSYHELLDCIEGKLCMLAAAGG